jgi:hypothetical protein
LQAIWVFLTDFGDTAVTVPLALLMAGFLVAAREPRLAIGWGLAIVGCAGAIGGLKLVFAVCSHPPGLASPSGHTAMSIAVYGGFAAVVGAILKGPARAALIAGAAVPVIGIPLSRTIVSGHTKIEVAAGLAVGIAALGAIIAIVARYRPGRLPLAWLAAGTLTVFVLFHGTRWPAEQTIHGFAALLPFLRPYCS